MKKSVICIITVALIFIACFSVSVLAKTGDIPDLSLLETVDDKDVCTSRGDVNSTGDVTSADARLILRYAVGLELFDDNQKLLADLDNSDSISSADARLALRISVGLDKQPGHSVIRVTSTPATCTADGEDAQICVYCGKLYSHTVTKAKGHMGSAWKTVTPSTCTETGKAVRYCIYCDKIMSEKELPLTSHLYGNLITQTAPTCLDGGTAYRECRACGKRETTELKATGHDIKWVVTKPATCTEDGLTEKKCVNCDLVWESATIYCTGHTYSSVRMVVTKPTCTENGIEGRVCTKCGAVTDVVTLPATGHTYVPGSETVTLAPTCTESGTANAICTKCAEFYELILPATGHTVSGGYTTLTPATCTEEGTETGTCDICLKTVSRPIPATGHVYSAPVTVPATCSQTGTVTYTCTVCSATDVKTLKINPDNHPANAIDENFTVREATCTTNRTYCKACTACGKRMTPEYYEFNTKLGHTAGNCTDITPATCTEPGEQTGTCIRCGIEVTEIIPATGHDFETLSYTAPTCTESGSASYKCKVCGETKDEILAPAGHMAVIDAAVPATCTETGLTSGFHCSVCGKTIAAQAVTKALGHTYDDSTYTVITAPDCTNEGSATAICTRCGKTIDIVIPAKGHSYDSSVILSVSTCVTPGVKQSVCSICSYVNNENLPLNPDNHPAGDVDADYTVKEATCTTNRTYCTACVSCGKHLSPEYYELNSKLGHTAGNCTVTVPATCTEPGEQTGTCIRCGVAVTEIIPATGHDFETLSYTAPTCTESGSASYKCTRCGETKDEILAPAGHMAVTDAAVPATCTETGLTSGFHCSVCGKTIAAQAVTKALGHTYDDSTYTVITAPDCTNEGSATAICTRCGKTIDIVLPAKGHCYDNSVILSVSTCVTPGVKQSVCSVCSYVNNVNLPLNPDNHPAGDIDTDYTVKEATCTTNRIYCTACTSCGKHLSPEYYELSTKLGHTAGGWTVTVPATCTEDGEKIMTCIRCSEVFETAVIEKTGHTPGAAETLRLPTCTEAGLYGTKCTVCDAIVSSEEIPVLGHSYGEWQTVTAPTCTVPGEKIHYCTVCGEAQSEEFVKIDTTACQLNITFSPDSSCAPGGTVRFKVEDSPLTVKVMFSYGKDTTHTITKSGGYYSFIVPSDIGIFDPVSIIVTAE